jgi:hypothetical protein
VARIRPFHGLAVLGLATVPWHAVHAQTPAVPLIPLELNKLEPLSAPANGCRFYLVTSNPDAEPVTEFRLDLIVFGTDGVIARRVAVNLAPLPARKTAVRPFDLPGVPCDGVGRVLVNDVLACRIGLRVDPPPSPCLERLQLSSHARAELAK